MAHTTLCKAQSRFLELLAQSESEPVEIFQKGERVAVVLSSDMYEKSCEALEEQLDEKAYDAADRNNVTAWGDITEKLRLP